MTGFDIMVLLIVGVGAIAGFMRGFVQEALSLLAWIAAIAAIRYMHTDLTAGVMDFVSSPVTASILAFALLLLIPYAIIKLLANMLGKGTRNSVLGPIDRVLGFGFGAVKGVIIVVIAFSVLVLGYDTIWGAQGRPAWIADARTYQFVDAGSRAMVQIVAERRERLQSDAE
ncbi:CvpA family protein [Aurantiacibacter gangjinensis]|uniref:Colicin V production protein n=1 Tax=Aurantiacibacter gangjinensis TaxID=502682 RepID=A0A0G9MQQ7_9SPHN|nr:CvpA family protein [Aurantiacibacter gangjinensis]APE28759.1 Colicin V production protein [Aurantiacibacter gangjinensis]KLE32914.1 colicin V production protein [Aurantiacibacter gangjinensis]